MKRDKLNNIYLIGPMGSGKTSVGKSLASLTQQTLYDSDQEIERSTGVDISWIFEVEGEAGFRKREENVITELTQMNHIILSTGGGAVLAESNRQRLAENGVVVYLQVSVNKQLKRTAHRKESRPVLMMNDSKEKLTKLNEMRDPLYREIADFTYQTDTLTPQSIAQTILHDINQLKNKDS